MSPKKTQKTSTKNNPEKIIGKYFLSFIVFHFSLNSNSKTQLENKPIIETLIRNLPRLIPKASKRMKKTYVFLCKVLLNN